MSWQCLKCRFPANPDERVDCFKCGEPKRIHNSPPIFDSSAHEPKLPSLWFLLRLGYRSNDEINPRDYSILLRIANLCNWIAITIVQLSVLAAIFVIIKVCLTSKYLDMLWIVMAGIIGNAIIQWAIFQGASRLIIMAVNIAKDIESLSKAAVDHTNVK